ncbi:MAG TPA: tripartite tricarboxylate transporter substrate binding protein [Xanthobacteraceae bacterium]
MLTRRRFVAGTAALAAGGITCARAQSGVEGWPTRSIRVISPTGAGGPSENFRLYAEYLKAKFGQPFTMEYMPGSSGAIGAMAAARAAPDGHTLLICSNSVTILAPLVIDKHPLDLKRDLVPIVHLFSFRFLLVANPKLGVKTLKEFVDYAKARPGQLNYGSPGIGTGGHVVTELLLKRTGIEAVHVPYQATTQQMMAAAGGHLDFTFDTPGNARGMVEAGKLIPLAVSGKGRASVMPDVPSLGELGHPVFDGLFVSSSLLAPAGTPMPIIEALNREILASQSKPDIRERMEKGSYEQGTQTVAETVAFFEADYRNWSEVIRETGIKVRK